MQANQKSPNYSGILVVLGLIVMIVGLVIMLVLPDIKLAAWGIMAIGVALIVVAIVLSFRQVKKAITGRRGKFGLGTGVMSAIFIGIVIIVNAFSVGNYHRFDTSSLSRFTLTPQTIEVLEDLQSDVIITGFFIPNDTYGIGDYVSSFLTEYEEHTSHISIKYIDPDTNPDQAKEYGITEYQTVVFECGENRRLVPPSSYVTTDSSGNLSGIQAEYPFTSAILEVTGVAQKKVYLLTGDGEVATTSSFSKADQGLLDDLYQIDTVNLIKDPQIPDDCAALIIAAPQNTLSDSEIEIINNYLNGGGQVMILTNPNSSPELDKIVSNWGINFGNGTIIDPGSSVAPHEDMPIVSSDNNHYGLSAVYFPGATAIVPQENLPSNITMYPLAWTTASSWLDKDYSADKPAAFDPATETKESLAIGALIAGVTEEGSAKGKYTRLAVIGDSDFATDDNYDSANNGDLFLNAVSWLAKETTLVSIHRNVQPFRLLVVNSTQSSFIKYSSILMFPIILLLAAVVIWWRRR